MPINDQEIEVALDRDVFVNTLLGELADVLQNIAGDDDAAGIVSIVAQRIGEHLNSVYQSAYDTKHLDLDQVSRTLVDIKRRIEGDFYIVSIDPEKIVLKNRRCPFGKHVVGRKSLCMMTSTVFGVIASDNLGYAKVEMVDTIAAGARQCEVVVYLKQNDESKAAEGQEYLPSHNR